MELLLIGIYISICWAIFKIFGLSLNKWTVPTAVLGGVVMIGSLLLLMNYNHPYSTLVRDYFVTTPIVPDVGGRVIEVAVKGDQRVKQGDVLIRIDPRPYEATVALRQAELRAALQKIEGYEAALSASTSESVQARADRDRSYDNYVRREKAGEAAGFAKAQVENLRQMYLADEAKLQAALAKELEAEVQLAVDASGENVLVAQAKANLASAQWELDRTVIRAPTDGFVSQLTLRPGMMAQPLPLRPIGVFVHLEETQLIGAFWQNSLQRIAPGDEAEVIFRAVPGKVFPGKVVKVLPVLAQG
ncbi:MAG TPA: HlyD family secretion protein, partial [Myxococcota bacterium]|nr:HlyD family secretion protein [Myxococcota bacterium]